MKEMVLFLSLNIVAFVLDGGLKIFIWLGKEAGKNEKFRAATVAREMKSERKGNIEVIRFELEIH
jgi:hypothetical protein